MSAQSPDFETREITLATKVEGGHMTDSTSNNEHLPSDIFEEKQDDVAVDAGENLEYATGLGLAMVMCTIFLTTLLAALDIGIVATAIPGITDDFHHLDDVGWYGSACFLLVGTSSPTWGKLYKYLSARYVYLASVLLFLIGSIVAATAPNSPALIVGRALQGWGCSGSLGGSVLMINYVAEPKKRPMLTGAWMGVFMCSTIVGPLIGGALTSEVTWRWCFWINLPVGGPVVALVLLFFHVPKHIKPVPASWKEILLQLDLPGFSLLLTSLVCFTLALQWGGQTKPWNDGTVIATLVMWVVLTIAFFTTEYLQGTYAMVPLHVLKPRMTWSNMLYGYIANLANFQVLFYLPIYFQSIHSQSAITSGVNSLPFMAFFALGAILSGFLIGKIHLLQPYELASGLIATAGAALLYTLEIDSSKARYIGPQVLIGIGIGLGNQVPMTALQSFSKPEDVASTTGVMLMCNSISGAYFVTAAQSLFSNRLLHTLSVTGPHIDASKVLATGASEIQRVFTGGDLEAVLGAYMVGIKDVFAFSLAGAAFTVLLAMIIPFEKLPGHDGNKMEGEKKEVSD
ncbi:probable permeases of the major facilitator superfamily [Phialocephala subalpina]|uniref:Probable permeases of the major facilitator superfamily n=1 Tax=Phialocephala subalpina TaxID=576137 RepID=A0A1L7XU63_9HELO|nr:probable permeases of the major facilitator superfamily [Phialocephala subalpina]